MNIELSHQPNNMLEENFSSIFLPMYIVSVPFCMRKYILYRGTVYVTTKWDIIAATIGNTIMYVLLYFTLTMSVIVLEDPSILCIYMVVYVIFSCNHTIHSVMNLVKTSCHVDILLKLQNIDKVLSDNQDRRILKIVVRSGILVLFAMYCALVFMKLYADPLWSWTRCIFIFLTVVFDLEMFYTVCIIYYLARKIRLWTNKMRCKRRFSTIREMIREDSNEINEDNEMVSILETIFDTIMKLENVSQLTILSYLIMLFFQALAYIQVWIKHLQKNKFGTLVLSSHTMGIVLWIVKGILVILMLCVCCEILYLNIKSATTATITFLIECYSYKRRRFAKRALRLIMIRYKKFNVCGLLTVDAALLLHFVAVITNYTIVLLQFTYL